VKSAETDREKYQLPLYPREGRTQKDGNGPKWGIAIFVDRTQLSSALSGIRSRKIPVRWHFCRPCVRVPS